MRINTFLVKLSSTFFGVGYLPFVPGTFGSLAGLFLYYFTGGNRSLQLMLIGSLLLLGFLVSGSAERCFNKRDPKYVVIDEVTGMLISLAFIPFNLTLAVTGFFLFRLLDTLKPYPASVLDKAKGSLGIMGDDIVAGLYANIVLQLALRFASFKVS